MTNYYKEGIVLLIIVYSLIWLIDEYLALLLCSCISIISAGILVFSLLAELIQRSRVPRAYFWWMLISASVPALVSIFFTLIYQGSFDWVKN